jgi:hypothetical protein
VRIENNTALIPNWSGMGVIFLGDQIGGGGHPFPITGHPTSLTGYYKYAPLNGDTMYIEIFLISNSSGQVSSGSYTTTTSASNWTPFSIPLSTYTSADSGMMSMSAYYAVDQPPQYIPHGNSVLYIDNLNFDNLISSVPEQTVKKPLFNIYPNPAFEIVTLNIDNRNNADLTLKIYNITGELVRSELLKQNQQKINIGDLNNGIYMVEINSNEWSGIQKLIIQR